MLPARLVVRCLLAACLFGAPVLPAAEPWATCPAWVNAPLIDAPPVVIADAPFPAEIGEVTDPIAPGDRLLEVADPRELLLRIGRQPLEEDCFQVTVQRGTEHLQLMVDRVHLTRHLQNLRWSANGAERLAALGMTGDREALNRLPARVVSHLVAAGATPGTQRLVATWLALEAGGALPIAGEPLADPFLAQCERLWRNAGAEGDPQPDPWAWGIEPEFAALYLPYPGAAAPALGELKLTDQEFVATLTKVLTTIPTASLPERRDQARKRIRGGIDADTYLGQVQAAVLDPERHGGWPYRSALIWETLPRNQILSQLRERRAAGGPDRPLVDLGLVCPLALSHADDEVVAVLAELRQDSPLLARSAFTMLEYASEMHDDLAPLKKRLAELDAAQPTVPRPSRMGLYKLLQSRLPTNTIHPSFPIYDQTCGIPAAMRSDPTAIAEALAPWWDVRRNGAAETRTLVGRLNEVAWWLAVDPRCIDSTAAGELARQMRHLQGRMLAGYALDTVAACLARTKDFPTAVRLQRLALRQAGAKDLGYAERLAAYEQETAYSETTELVLKPLRLDHQLWPTGQLKAEGRREIESGQRYGRWRVLNEAGVLEEEQPWRNDQQTGWTRRYFPDGTVREEGAVVEGAKTGRWRTYDAKGTLRQEVWWLGTPDGGQTGWAETWHPDHTVAEAGPWLDGRQEGFWQAWRAGGAPASAGRYHLGDATGIWRTWTADGIMTERKLAPGATGAGDLF
jgi:antitoxin component YwqK of YwqJK toxin-antitoxin module